MIHKKHLIFLFTILLLTVHSVNAEVKIGIVKLDILFKEIPIYKESQKKMKEEFEPRADELKKIETSWNKLNDDYLKNERVMSKNERKDKIDEINKVEKEFREKQQTLQKELQNKQNSDKIINEIKSSVKYLKLKSMSSDNNLVQYNFWFDIEKNKLQNFIKKIEKITLNNKNLNIQLYSRSGIYE